jgi:hypothetical protein
MLINRFFFQIYLVALNSFNGPTLSREHCYPRHYLASRSLKYIGALSNFQLPNLNKQFALPDFNGNGSLGSGEKRHWEHTTGKQGSLAGAYKHGVRLHKLLTDGGWG